MDLKYDAELGRYNNCPPAKAEPRRQPAFRFVFDDIADSRNFLPPALRQPQRAFRENQKCISMALSMFEKREDAIKRYNGLKRRHRNIHKAIGTHLAQGEIEKTDGLTTPLAKGHFSLFEAKDANLAGKFEIVEAICDA